MSYRPPAEPHAIAFKAFELFENGHGNLGRGAISTLGVMLREEYGDIDRLAHAVSSLAMVMLFAKEEGAMQTYERLLELIQSTRPEFEAWRNDKDKLAWVTVELDALLGRAPEVKAAPKYDAPAPAGTVRARDIVPQRRWR